MKEIPGYTIREKIIDGYFWELYRGNEINSGTPVMFKRPRPELSSQIDLARFRNEYEILKSKTLIATHGLIENNQSTVHIIADVPGIALNTQLKEAKFDAEQFLKLAIRFAELLHHIHRQKVVVKGLHSESVLIDPQGYKVAVIDYSHASLLKVQRPNVAGIPLVPDRLAYMSPEQTGRMNRDIDYRTDFYSLGVLFYEMLVGWRPFQTDDPLEMIHAHIAGQARPPHALNRSIPVPVSEIIMKLMAKNAEERYQSALGLKSDLETCLNAYRSANEVAAFPLGKHEILDEFQIPQKLYGRREQIDQLLNVFEEVSAGSNQLVLIPGPPGIGKSVLVNEIQKPVVKAHGFFISGKFEELSRDTPYSSLLQALQELVRQLLTESSEKLAVWKDRIIKTLGSNARVVSDVIPDLEWIIGQTKRVPTLPPRETQNRFNLVFKNFVRLFGRRENPLVIFLDDLQWADNATLALVHQFLRDPALKYFLLIAAYRDKEIDSTHPLTHFLSDIREAKAAVRTIMIQPLDTPHIREMITDTFRCDEPEARPLAAIVQQKTLGNPFFIKYFLQSLYQNNLLYFQYAADDQHLQGRREAGWRWDIDKIEQMGFTENVIDWLIESLQRLPEETVEVLKIAACIGMDFDSQLLSKMTHRGNTAVARALWEAIQQGMILEKNRQYNSDGREHWTVSYKFVHNRIQEAAYALMAPARRNKVHLKIGRLLLETFKKQDREDLLFAVVNQLNAGNAYIINETEMMALAELNYRAGKRARDASAHKSAQAYFRMGVQALPPDAWERCYDLTRQIYFEKGEIEYINVQYDQAEKDLNLILENAPTSIDKARVYAIRVRMYVSQSRLEDSLTAGIHGLKLLNFKFPRSPVKPLVFANMLITSLRLLRRSQKQLYDMPEMRSPEAKLALNIITDLLAFAYNTSADLFMILLMTMIKITLKYGNADASSYAYGGFGVIAGSGFGLFQKGDAFGRLQVRLSDKFPDSYFRGRTYFGYACLIKHWMHPLKESQVDYDKALKYSLQNGDFLYAANTINNILWFDMVRGLNLKRLYEKGREYLDFMDQIQYEDLRLSPEFALQYVHALRGQAPDVLQSNKEPFVQAAFEERLEQTEFTQVRVSYRIMRSQLYYLFGEYDSAHSLLNKVDSELHAVIGHITLPEYHFYRALNQCQRASRSAGEQKWRMLKQARRHVKKLQTWAKHNHYNFYHKHCLAHAEIYRLERNDHQAFQLYERAIQSATDNGFIQDAAIAKELAARFYLSQDSKRVALTYLLDAVEDYRKWDAEGKLKHLQTEFDTVFDSGLWQKWLTAQQNPDSMPNVDLKSLLKASETLYGEIVFDKLLHKLIQITLENAGAERGLLLLSKDDELFIEAEGWMETNQVEVTPMQVLETYADIAVNPVRYVERSRHTVVLDDAANAGDFQDDPYIAKNNILSLLVVPLMHKQSLTGILYLENNLVKGAFTEDRVRILRMLSTEIAISIENARLYTKLQNANEQLEEYSRTLERKVLERTRDLQRKSEELQKSKDALEKTVYNLELTKTQLVHSEKMASLGELTAGIAHEIKNPLNFINNFSAVSLEFGDEIKENLNRLSEKNDRVMLEETVGILEDLHKNIRRIHHHGKRADGIIHSMMMHSRGSSGQKEPSDINSLLKEALNLVYHSMRAQNPAFQIEIHEALQSDLPQIKVVPQDMSRVFLNLLNNACYAAYEKFKNAGGEAPQIRISSAVQDGCLRIRIKDNGAGIPEVNRERIFNPFFTTKPTGQGTGLGLSLSYDMVVKQHGGKLLLNSETGRYAEFVMELPL